MGTRERFISSPVCPDARKKKRNGTRAFRESPCSVLAYSRGNSPDRTDTTLLSFSLSLSLSLSFDEGNNDSSAVSTSLSLEGVRVGKEMHRGKRW